MEITRIDAPASRTAPGLSDRAPAKREAIVAESEKDGMMKPWIIDEREPKVSVKAGIVVAGPMVPVSGLLT
jgi:hypothetical protein